jgi:hypothetical protein
MFSGGGEPGRVHLGRPQDRYLALLYSLLGLLGAPLFNRQTWSSHERTTTAAADGSRP